MRDRPGSSARVTPRYGASGSTRNWSTKWRDCQMHSGVLIAKPMPAVTRLSSGSVLSNSKVRSIITSCASIRRSISAPMNERAL
ncbi:hypothetical protein D3C87_1570970 [compost metagenome]